MSVKREIKRRLDELTEILLHGDAPDFTAYRVAVAKRQMLEDLLEWIAARESAGNGDVDDDE